MQNTYLGTKKKIKIPIHISIVHLYWCMSPGRNVWISALLQVSWVTLVTYTLYSSIIQPGVRE